MATQSVSTEEDLLRWQPSRRCNQAERNRNAATEKTRAVDHAALHLLRKELQSNKSGQRQKERHQQKAHLPPPARPRTISTSSEPAITQVA